MNVAEAIKKYFHPINYSGITFLIGHRGGNLAITEINTSGGICDCCSVADNIDELKVLKVVDIEKEETLYDVKNNRAEARFKQNDKFIKGEWKNGKSSGL